MGAHPPGLSAEGLRASLERIAMDSRLAGKRTGCVSSPKPDPEATDGPFSGPPIFMELWCGVKGCSQLSSGARDVSREVCLGAQGEPRCCLWV